MKIGSQIHHRRSIRLSGFDYSQPGGYFITIVTYQRECLFGMIDNEEMILSNFGQVAKQQWEKLPCRFHNIELSRGIAGNLNDLDGETFCYAPTFVVMPNHIHGIILINDYCRGTAGNLKDLDKETSRYALTVQQQFGKRRSTAEDLNNLEEGVSCRAPTVKFGKPIPGSLSTIVRSYKASVSYRINLMRRTTNTPVWQRNYYEHVIRNQTDLETIYKYIQFNPIQWAKDEENPEWQSRP